jgi:hypothetical protein
LIEGDEDQDKISIVAARKLQLVDTEDSSSDSEGFSDSQLEKEQQEEVCFEQVSQSELVEEDEETTETCKEIRSHIL